jgi:hypothetical protein
LTSPQNAEMPNAGSTLGNAVFSPSLKQNRVCGKLMAGKFLGWNSQSFFYDNLKIIIKVRGAFT